MGKGLKGTRWLLHVVGRGGEGRSHTQERHHKERHHCLNSDEKQKTDFFKNFLSKSIYDISGII